jgi:hypothetical protein
LFRFTDQPPDAPQLRRELAMVINACGLLQGGKFKPENSTCNVHFMSRACHARAVDAALIIFNARGVC